MSRLLTDPRLPAEPQQLVLKLTSILRDISNQVNLATEGRIASFQSAQTTAPTAGTNSVGDWVLNSTPAELGTAGSKYTIFGWRCITAGTPGTWVQMRMLTGN